MAKPMNFYDWLERVLPVIGLSIAGGLARAVNQKERSFWGYLGSCIVAVFAGVVTYMLLEDLTGLSDWTKQAISSISAYSGGTFIDAMRDRLANIADVVIGGAKKK